MSAVESIVLTLLAFSISGWGVLCLAAEAQPLRDAGRRLLAAPVSDERDERLLFATMVAGAVWVLTPALLAINKQQLGVALGMTDQPLWGVMLNCISSIVVLLIIGPLAWFVLRKQASPQSSEAESAPLKPAQLIQRNFKAGGRAFLLAVLPVAVVLFATQTLRTKEAQHSLLQLLVDQPGAATVGSVLLAAVVLAPLVEELVFRVLLQGWLQSFLRPSVAIGIVALGFSAVHGWPNMLPLIPLALVLGVLFYFTRSYLAVVVTHGLFNVTNVILAVLTAQK
jgi:membrane protease YdiL (CAAX protease family)